MTQQDFTVDVPVLVGDEGASAVFGRLLWSLVIAPAITSQVKLANSDTLCWRGTLIPRAEPGQGARGQRFGAASSREHSPQLVLRTSGLDNASRRRVFLPGAPAGWSEGGLLSTAGFEGLTSHARALFMGLSPLTGADASRWMVAYPYAVTPDLGNAFGVGFRDVEFVRVCEHTDRAPDLTSAIWP
jgi:hypothetical protein